MTTLTWRFKLSVLTHCPGRYMYGCDFWNKIFNRILLIGIFRHFFIMSLDEWNGTYWPPGALANVDPDICRRMVSLSHNLWNFFTTIGYRQLSKKIYMIHRTPFCYSTFPLRLRDNHIVLDLLSLLVFKTTGTSKCLPLIVPFSGRCINSKHSAILCSLRIKWEKNIH